MENKSIYQRGSRHGRGPKGTCIDCKKKVNQCSFWDDRCGRCRNKLKITN